MRGKFGRICKGKKGRLSNRYKRVIHIGIR